MRVKDIVGRGGEHQDGAGGKRMKRLRLRDTHTQLGSPCELDGMIRMVNQLLVAISLLEIQNGGTKFPGKSVTGCSLGANTSLQQAAITNKC